LPGITLEHLDAMYSTTRKQGGKEPVTTWGAAGVPEMGTRKISLYGRDEASGTRSFFKEKVLLKGEFRPGINVVNDCATLLEAVSLDAGAIGYCSVSEVNTLVRTLPVSSGDGPKISPTPDAILKGDYPLVRFLYLYVNKAPGKPLPVAISAFLSFALSKEGQTAVAASGLPIPADVCRTMLAKVQ
jgi:phosphate transport system substrate-binding protein